MAPRGNNAALRDVPRNHGGVEFVTDIVQKLAIQTTILHFNQMLSLLPIRLVKQLMMKKRRNLLIRGFGGLILD
jgi:hypothetical protein